MRSWPYVLFFWAACHPFVATAQNQVFGDIAVNSQFYASTAGMYASGITAGCVAGNPPTLPLFCPTTPIPRWQMAIFLVRAWSIRLFGAPEAFQDFAPPSTTAHFADVASSSFYFPHVQKLYELGITAGCGNGNFCPDNSLLNSQAAIFAARTRQVADTGCLGMAIDLQWLRIFHTPPRLRISTISPIPFTNSGTFSVPCN